MKPKLDITDNQSKDRTVSFRIHEKHYDFIEKEAKKLKVSQGRILRALIRKAMEK